MLPNERAAALASLRSLCACHATPGDEGEVFALLSGIWREQGLEVFSLGAYAVCARRAPTGKPVLLITAHADSPGFAVSELPGGDLPENHVKLTAMGAPHIENDVEACLKTETGRHDVFIYGSGVGARLSRSEPQLCHVADPAVCAALRPGDRIAWNPSFTVRDDGVIESPFLDNRLGCALLADWFSAPSPLEERFDVVLGVTALEEMNGFGAAVLARRIAPDAVVALDATYASAEQRIVVGGGPVLTLSDASVVLSPAVRDALLAAAERAGLPLQLEVYNTSGTDAKAFPLQGLPAPVLPLLLPTGGNHSPLETAHLDDFLRWRPMIEALVPALIPAP